MNKIALSIVGLSKTYKDGTKALNNISLQVSQGEFFGLLGPNGAGKSTLIGILSTLVSASSGEVTINGYSMTTNSTDAKRSLGIVPQEFNFNVFETCLQVIVQQAGYYGISEKRAKKRALELLRDLGLENKIKTQVRMLSGGMKRRLMIARALVHDPKILLLDEPTAGIDIELRHQLWDFLVRENKKGLTIILTTHNLDEAEVLCERIGIINYGKIIALDKTSNLLEQLHSEVIVLYSKNKIRKLPKLKQPFKKINDNTLEVEITKDITITTLLSTLNKQGIEIDRMKNKSNRLEELFLRLVKKK